MIDDNMLKRQTERERKRKKDKGNMRGRQKKRKHIVLGWGVLTVSLVRRCGWLHTCARSSTETTGTTPPHQP